jgi:hypothetical protein
MSKPVRCKFSYWWLSTDLDMAGHRNQNQRGLAGVRWDSTLVGADCENECVELRSTGLICHFALTAFNESIHTCTYNSAKGLVAAAQGDEHMAMKRPIRQEITAKVN